MIWSANQVISISVLMLLLYTKFNTFLPLDFGWTVSIDMILRCNLNDSIVSRYYFFWTNFYYLPTFYFNTLTIVMIFLLYQGPLYYLAFYLIYLTFYNMELLDFLTLNSTLHVFDYYKSFTNILLTNALNKYHPYIFYIGTLFVFATVIINLLYSYKQVELCWLNKWSTSVHSVNSKIFMTLALTLFMGSWWALQEGSWGGWWDWDPSEMLGLLFLVITLTIIHSSYMLNQFYRFCHKYVVLVFSALLCYCLVQLNFEFVAHNFGIKSFFLLNNNSIFLEMLLFTVIILVIYFKNIIINFNRWFNLITPQTSTLSRSNINTVFTTFVIFILLLYFLFTFIPLINYFNNNFWTVDLTSIKKSINILNILSLFTLLSYFSSYRLLNIYLVVIGFINSPSVVLCFICMLQYFLSTVSILHGAIVMFFLLNLQYNELLTNVDNSWIYLVDTIFNNNNFYLLGFIYTCDGISIEFSQLLVTHYESIILSWNVIMGGNVLDVETFVLGFDSTCMWNIYNTGVLYSLENQLISYNGLGLVFFTFVSIVFIYIVRSLVTRYCIY